MDTDDDDVGKVAAQKTDILQAGGFAGEKVLHLHITRRIVIIGTLTFAFSHVLAPYFYRRHKYQRFNPAAFKRSADATYCVLA